MLFGLVIGGMQSLAGAILGGLFLQFFPDVTAGLGKGLSVLLYAVLLIAATVAMPEGVAGALKKLKSLLGARHSSGAHAMPKHEERGATGVARSQQ